MADRGRTPDLATIVGVEKAFFHCGRCITRSGLWDDGGYRAQAAES
jgi:predicted pyridoxine 5'-phosphate oxidase superfamily flavin-nucleotide-binding protein